MTHYAVDPLIKRVQEWFRHIEPLLPPGELESAWELMGDGEMAIALDSATDKLEKLNRPLNDDELRELEELLRLNRMGKEEVDKYLNWVRTLGRKSTQS